MTRTQKNKHGNTRSWLNSPDCHPSKTKKRWLIAKCLLRDTCPPTIRIICNGLHVKLLDNDRIQSHRSENCKIPYGFCRRSPGNSQNKRDQGKVMAPKATRNQNQPSDPQGMFAGMVVFLVENGVQSRRLQIWKKKLVQMGASIEERLTKKVTHILAMSPKALLERVGSEKLANFKGSVLVYQWLEDSLSSGKLVSEDLYPLKLEAEKSSSDYVSSDDEEPKPKKRRSSSPGDELAQTSIPKTPEAPNKDQVASLESTVPYSPPDLNRNITEIFGKLINIYRALGDDRRSFSYYKAIAVIEKLPFKIQSMDQVKDLPNIGKSMQDHIQEIVTTGKLSKLEHFETDEKVLERSSVNL